MQSSRLLTSRMLFENCFPNGFVCFFFFFLRGWGAIFWLGYQGLLFFVRKLFPHNFCGTARASGFPSQQGKGEEAKKKLSKAGPLGQGPPRAASSAPGSGGRPPAHVCTGSYCWDLLPRNFPWPWLLFGSQGRKATPPARSTPGF